MGSYPISDKGRVHGVFCRGAAGRRGKRGSARRHLALCRGRHLQVARTQVFGKEANVFQVRPLQIPTPRSLGALHEPGSVEKAAAIAELRVSIDCRGQCLHVRVINADFAAHLGRPDAAEVVGRTTQSPVRMVPARAPAWAMRASISSSPYPASFASTRVAEPTAHPCATMKSISGSLSAVAPKPLPISRLWRR